MINAKDKFLIVKELSCKYTVKLLCNIAAVSRSGYYKWLNKGNKDISYSELDNKIIEIYNKSKKVYGYRRIKVALLREFGIRINHKKILRLMRKLNIKSVIRKKNLSITNLKLNIALLKKIFLIGTLKQKRLMRNGLQILHICFTKMARKRLIYQRLKIYLTMKLLHIKSVNI